MYSGGASARRTSSLFSNKIKPKAIDTAMEKMKKSADAVEKKAKEEDEKATGTVWIEVVRRIGMRMGIRRVGGVRYALNDL